MKNNTKLIIGISLPVLVIIFVIGAVLLPKLFFNPKYDFIYSVDQYCANYDCRFPSINGYGAWSAYKVESGRISKESKLPVQRIFDSNSNSYQEKPVEPVYPKLYRYIATTGSFNEISLEDAQRLVLTDSGSAPDGTVVVNESRGGSGFVGEILGGGGRDYGLYMKNGSFSKKIIVQNGVSTDYYYNSNFHLLGWVK